MLALFACAPPPPHVVIYTSQDQVFAEPLLRKFTEQTGIQVRAVYDSEAVKTVGLANRLLAEKGRPQCDVFWSNEELRTRQLATAGVFRETNGWFSLGYRSRRLICNTNHVQAAQAPRNLADLTHPAWRGKVALAYPLFGTTATHFATLRQVWGEERWHRWCQDLITNKVMVVDGNSVVAKLVASGEAWIGLTDSDDALGQVRRGAPIAILDLSKDMLLIRNSVGIVAGCPHPTEAERLADFLRSPLTLQALVTADALEGEDPARVGQATLQTDWNRLLTDLAKELVDTTKKLETLFLR
jgi:iron(III) transport system substrate-binding protein